MNAIEIFEREALKLYHDVLEFTEDKSSFDSLGEAEKKLVIAMKGHLEEYLSGKLPLSGAV